MKLIIRDNDNRDHIVIEKVEHEFSTQHVGEIVLEYVQRIDIESPCCGRIGRHESH